MWFFGLSVMLKFKWNFACTTLVMPVWQALGASRVASNTVRVKFLEIPSRVPAAPGTSARAGFEVKVKDVSLFVRSSSDSNFRSFIYCDFNADACLYFWFWMVWEGSNKNVSCCAIVMLWTSISKKKSWNKQAEAGWPFWKTPKRLKRCWISKNS